MGTIGRFRLLVPFLPRMAARRTQVRATVAVATTPNVAEREKTCWSC